MMAEIQPPSYVGDGCYTTDQDRAVYSSLVCEEGVAFGACGGDLEVHDSAAGGMTITVESGAAFIEGDNVPCQGRYHVQNDAPVDLTLQASDPTDTRIDLVVATVTDSTYGGTSGWELQVITGTPSPAPTPPAVPPNSIVLAQVTVTPGMIEVTDANITDLRSGYGMCGGGGGEMMVITSGMNFQKASFPATRYRIRGVGGGGGGSGSQGPAAGEASAGDGGGAGGYFEFTVAAADLADSEPVTVGGGGAGANPGGTGANGGNTSFGTWGTGNGGRSGNGQIVAGTSPALRGVPSNTGTATCPTGIAIPGGPAGTGAIRLSGTQSISGAGGRSPLGAGGRAISGTSVAGDAGTGYGSGGSGGNAQNGGTGAGGGNGAPGIVIVEAI